MIALASSFIFEMVDSISRSSNCVLKVLPRSALGSLTAACSMRTLALTKVGNVPFSLLSMSSACLLPRPESLQIAAAVVLADSRSKLALAESKLPFSEVRLRIATLRRCLALLMISSGLLLLMLVALAAG